MKVIEITASYGRTIQFRSFEPIKIPIYIKAEIEDGDDYVQGIKLLQKVAAEVVDEEIVRLMEEREQLNLEELKPEISEVLKKIDGCKSREEKVRLWSDTKPELRRVKEVLLAFKK